MTITTTEKNQDVLKKWIEERKQLINQKFKLSERIDSLTRYIDAYEKDELTVSEHAIDRFEQRFMKMPRTKIRRLLSETSLLERYKKKGAGKYRLKALSHCICVVKDYRVITVFNREDPIENLEIAREWIHLCIDKEFKDTPTFEQFRKKYYY